MNEGLESLGRPKISDEQEENGVFSGSAIESVRVPSTLKVIERDTFSKCESLRNVEFTEGLEKIEACAFSESGIESIATPATLKEVSRESFKMC